MMFVLHHEHNPPPYFYRIGGASCLSILRFSSLVKDEVIFIQENSPHLKVSSERNRGYTSSHPSQLFLLKVLLLDLLTHVCVLLDTRG